MERRWRQSNKRRHPSHSIINFEGIVLNVNYFCRRVASAGNVTLALARVTSAKNVTPAVAASSLLCVKRH
jgi:hypothetical protein